MVDVPTSLRSAAIAICRRTATTIAGLRSPAPIVRHRLAHTVRRRLARIVHRARARTQSRGRAPRPGLILPRPGAIRRPPVPIPHQAKVTAVVAVAAATEVEVTAVALVVVAEVHVAGVPLRIRGTKFISQLRTPRSSLPGGLFSLRAGYSRCIRLSDSVRKKSLYRFFLSRPSPSCGTLHAYMYSPEQRMQLLLP